MIETGVNLTLQDNASATARRVAAGFEEVAKSADGINSALDPAVLDQYNQKLTEIGEAYSKLNRGISQQNKSQVQQMQHTQQIFAGMGTSMVQAGRGDVVGGALSGVKSMAGLAGKISPAVAGGLAAVVGVGLAGNALANIYGGRADAAGDVARLSGDMGTDIASNTLALRDAMSSTTNAVKAYGKTFEEGAAAAQTFLKAGGSNFAGTSQAAAYSLARSADFSSLASFEGMTQRYGISGSLGIVDALMMSQGLDIKHFEEVMGGYQGIVSSRLGRGISGGGGDIARQLEFFSNAGVTWQGALGAQKVQGLNQAVAGAAGLQQQSDLFLYRAAAKITGGGLIETQMLMEKGLSPELFQGVMGQFGEMGLDKTATIKQIQNTLSISVTDANALYNMWAAGTSVSGTKYEGLGGLATGAGATTETGYKSDIESVKQWMAEFGAGVYDLRVNAIDVTIEGFKGLINAGDTLTTTFQDVAETIKDIFTIKEDDRYTRLKRQISQASAVPHRDKLIRTLREAEEAGVSFEDLDVPKFFGFQSYITQGEELIAEIKNLIKATEDTTKAVNSDTILEDNTGKDQPFVWGGDL